MHSKVSLGNQIADRKTAQRVYKLGNDLYSYNDEKPNIYSSYNVASQGDTAMGVPNMPGSIPNMPNVPVVRRGGMGGVNR